MLQLPASPRLRPGFTRAPTPPSAPHVIALRAARDSVAVSTSCSARKTAMLASASLRSRLPKRALALPCQSTAARAKLNGSPYPSISATRRLQPSRYATLPTRQASSRLIRTLQSSSEWAARARHTASAIGDRQMLPVQMNSTLWVAMSASTQRGGQVGEGPCPCHAILEDSQQMLAIGREHHR